MVDTKIFDFFENPHRENPSTAPGRNHQITTLQSLHQRMCILKIGIIFLLLSPIFNFMA